MHYVLHLVNICIKLQHRHEYDIFSCRTVLAESANRKTSWVGNILYSHLGLLCVLSPFSTPHSWLDAKYEYLVLNNILRMTLKFMRNI